MQESAPDNIISISATDKILNICSWQVFKYWI